MKIMILKTLAISFALLSIAMCFTINQEPQNVEFNFKPLGVQFVTIRGIYPDQKLASNDKIYLRGSGCNLNWTSGIPLNHNAANTWTVLLSCQTNVTVQVKLLLNDKVWMMGGNEWVVALNKPELIIYPSFSPSINRVQDTEVVQSLILKNSRKCTLYLPPSYFDNTLKKYPVIFMHDGQNLFEDSRAAFGVAWKIQDTLNDLIGKGEIIEVIVVGIWNTNDRTNEYTYSYDPAYKFGGKGDLYLNFIQQELQPIVRQKWLINRIKQGGYTIGGSSLGGLISCYAMYKRSDFFPNAICMSSSFWWNSEDFDNKILSPSYNNTTRVYLDSGDAGDSQDGKNQTLTVKAHMEKIGYMNSGADQNLWYYLDKGGQHNEYYWGKRFHVPVLALFGTAPRTDQK